MKSVLFVVHTLQVGGAEKILINILKNMDKTKYNITVLALVDDGILIDDVKNINGVKYTYVFKSFFKNARANQDSKFHKIATNIMVKIWKIYLNKIKNSSCKLYKHKVKEKYDVEIAFLEGKVSKFVSCSNNKNSKKIAWIHTDISAAPNIIFRNDEEEKECYEKFDKIVCVSEEVKNNFSIKTGITDNLYVQLNPIDSNDIIKKSNEELVGDFSKKDLIVCTVGRLVNAKGYDRLLKVHKRLMDESIKHTLWIVGEGNERSQLEQYIQANNLQDSVYLIGYTNNPYKYIKNSDIYICTSRIEGLSSAILEATILEKVIVSTDCPGSKEILGEKNENAMIVNNNLESIYLGLKKVLTDEKLRDQYSKNIKKRSGLFNLNTTIKQIEKIIDE